MARPLPFKDHFSETRLFIRRVIAAVVIILLLMGVTVSRLVYLQVLNHRHYTTLSNDNRVKLVATPPTRGLIYDRDGVVLAENRPTYRLEITPEQVEDMEGLLGKLGNIIAVPDDDLKRFRLLLQRKRGFEGIPLRFHLTDEEVARLAVIQHRLPGVHIVARLSRHYPKGKTFAHVIGYVGRIDVSDLDSLDETNYRGTSHTGKVGIEKRYEDQLHGRVGHRQVETNAEGRVLRTLQRTPPQPGRNLYLTLDASLQRAAELALGDYNGAIVALDPRNGEILALVSKPAYDPNAFVRGLSTKGYNALRRDPDEPLYNRALLGRYSPGSTLKPFLGLAALHYGVIAPQETQFCPGYYRLPDEERKFRDWKAHGYVDLDKAITQSCDVYFYDLARKLGIDRIHAFLSRFGFGRTTGVDMHAERAGLLPSRAWKRRTTGMVWFPGETLNTGIGQGHTLITPLQLATATAALANRGRRVQPHVVMATESPAAGQRQPRQTATPPPVEGVKAEHWQRIVESMKHVVSGAHGTAWRLREAPYTIAGKTGTVQVFEIEQEEEYDEEEVAEHLRDHALFIAFAPVEEPTIVVAVVVEHGGSGGSVAAPIARKVLDHYLLADRAETAP